MTCARRPRRAGSDRARAEAALHLAKVRAAGNEAQADCIRLIDRAEKLVGEQLIAAKEAGEVRPGAGRPAKSSEALSISDLGISYDQSADWQRRAKVADAVVDNAIADALTEGRAAASGKPGPPERARL